MIFISWKKFKDWSIGGFEKIVSEKIEKLKNFKIDFGLEP